MTTSAAPPTPAEPPPKREAVIDRYERHMDSAKWAARGVGALYATTRFLAYCNLTWATVILLNNFQQSLPNVHFWAVACLLLLEAARLSSAAFFARLLTRGLVFLSQNPQSLDNRNDAHYRRANLLRTFSHVLQFLLILPSAAASAAFLRYLHNRAAPLNQYLYVFYVLVIISSAASFLAMSSSAISYKFLMRATGGDHTILRFYDRVLRNSFGSNGIGGGGSLVEADSFHFFEFAYAQLLAGDMARNVQPLAIVLNNRRLIEYLFAHRHGFDFLVTYLDASDAYVQQAAANMVGFWSDPPPPAVLALPDISLPVFVVSKLGDKLGTGQVGWAATNSVGALARKQPELVLQARTSDGKSLVKKLAEIVDGTSNRSLVAVRALVALLDKKLAAGDEEDASWAAAVALLGGDRVELMEKLRKLFENDDNVNRLRAMAGYLLLILMGPDEVRAGNSVNVVGKDVVERIDFCVVTKKEGKRNKYVYRSECTMLDVLRCHVHLNCLNWVRVSNDVKIHEDIPICPPSWTKYDPNLHHTNANGNVNGYHYVVNNTR